VSFIRDKNCNIWPPPPAAGKPRQIRTPPPPTPPPPPPPPPPLLIDNPKPVTFQDATIRLWDIRSDSTRSTIPPPTVISGGSDPIRCLCFSNSKPVLIFDLLAADPEIPFKILTEILFQRHLMAPRQVRDDCSRPREWCVKWPLSCPQSLYWLDRSCHVAAFLFTRTFCHILTGKLELWDIRNISQVPIVTPRFIAASVQSRAISNLARFPTAFRPIFPKLNNLTPCLLLQPERSILSHQPPAYCAEWHPTHKGDAQPANPAGF
jgi:hypothetical protein